MTEPILIKIDDIARMIGDETKTRRTTFRLVKQKNFPEPCDIPGIRRWRKHEVQHFLNSA